jgi:hypothetical protein
MKRIAVFIPLTALAFAAACGDSPTGLAEKPFDEAPVFDDIPNSLDGTVDAVAEVMPLALGGPNGTTQLSVVTQNEDGKNGCNLTGSTTLVVSVTSSDLAVATVSPSSVTFTSCGATPNLTITPVGVGTATISLSQVSNSTAGTFDLTTATFTVNVTPASPSNTPPTISVTGVTGGAYEIGAVPAAVCSVTDAEDGPSTFAATLSAITGPLAAYGLGMQEASCSYTDAGGLTASASVTYSIVDTTDPVIFFVSRTPAANGNGWNNSDVTVEWSCSDNGSGAVSATVTQFVSTEDANQSTIGTCQDHAGNTASDTQTNINIDKTAPTASADASPAANAYGWNNENVTVSFTGTDGLSGIDSCSADVVLSGEGAGQPASGTCSDRAGNVSAPASATINIDKTAPGVSLVGGPAEGASYYFCSVPAEPTCSASDDLSGLDGSCGVSGYSAAVGPHTVTATATDIAGNTSTASAAYTVLAWNLTGFYAPVSMEAGVFNTVKSGSTVPLKFEIFAAEELTSVAAVKSFVQAVISCPSASSITEDAVDVISTGGTVLRYDATDGQFIQNWQTPKNKAGICYRVTMTAQDGSTITAFFKLK